MSSFGIFEKYSTGISVSQQHIRGTADGYEDHIRRKVVKLYALEAIQENICHHLQQPMRPMQGLIFYKQYSLFPIVGKV
jgi:hypothetical protein